MKTIKGKILIGIVGVILFIVVTNIIIPYAINYFTKTETVYLKQMVVRFAVWNDPLVSEPEIVTWLSDEQKDRMNLLTFTIFTFDKRETIPSTDEVNKALLRACKKAGGNVVQLIRSEINHTKVMRVSMGT